MRRPSPDRRIVALALASVAGGAVVFACARDDSSFDAKLGVAHQASVFGTDDRRDYYAQPNTELQRLTRESIVASIEPGRLDFTNPNAIGVAATPTLQQKADLCSDQLFLDQPTVAHCSATLIDDDLIVSAGHCFADLGECRAHVYAFDYYYAAQGQLATMARSDVFGCRSLVVRQDSFDATRGRLDYAIIQLDRPVGLPHKPATVAAGFGSLASGDHVANIGFGEGLPAKLDDGASLLHPPQVDGFVATIDSFPGNSGGGVFRADYQLVGTLVTSTGVFVTTDAGCRAVHVLPDSGTPTGAATEARFVRNAITDLCAAGWPSARLCGVAAACGDGKCTGTEDSTTCAQDCAAPACGDGVCSPGEEKTCVIDCALGCSATSCGAGMACGDAGTCEPAPAVDASADASDGGTDFDASSAADVAPSAAHDDAAPPVSNPPEGNASTNTDSPANDDSGGGCTMVGRDSRDAATRGGFLALIGVASAIRRRRSVRSG